VLLATRERSCLNEDAHFTCPARARRQIAGRSGLLCGWLRNSQSLQPSLPHVRIEDRWHRQEPVKMLKTRESIFRSRCLFDQVGAQLVQRPLLWAFASEIDVPDPLPLAFFPTVSLS